MEPPFPRRQGCRSAARASRKAGPSGLRGRCPRLSGLPGRRSLGDRKDVGAAVVGRDPPVLLRVRVAWLGCCWYSSCAPRPLAARSSWPAADQLCAGASSQHGSVVLCEGSSHCCACSAGCCGCALKGCCCCCWASLSCACCCVRPRGRTLLCCTGSWGTCCTDRSTIASCVRVVPGARTTLRCKTGCGCRSCGCSHDSCCDVRWVMFTTAGGAG